MINKIYNKFTNVWYRYRTGKQFILSSIKIFLESIIIFIKKLEQFQQFYVLVNTLLVQVSSILLLVRYRTVSTGKKKQSYKSVVAISTIKCRTIPYCTVPYWDIISYFLKSKLKKKRKEWTSKNSIQNSIRYCTLRYGTVHTKIDIRTRVEYNIRQYCTIRCK